LNDEIDEKISTKKKTCKSKKTIATKRMRKKFDRKKIQRG
jgi:hypothetical protein